MTYVEGLIVPVPTNNREAYRRHAAQAASLFREFGATRILEAWESDVPEGKVTDFRKAVQAGQDESIVFTWFEYPSKAVRDAATARIMSDPRMKEIGESMPFDGKRMIFGGFEPIVEQGSGAGAYVDGIVVPVPNGNRDPYQAMAKRAAAKFRQYGALRVVESWGEDLPEGKLTDFRRAVQAKEGENVVYSWIEWPSKAVRDEAWPKLMADPDMQPDPGSMPFDGTHVLGRLRRDPGP